MASKQINRRRTLISDIVLGAGSERLACNVRRQPESLNDRLGVDLLLNQLLSLAKELASKHCDRGGAIADLLILGLGDINENLCRGIIQVNGLQDGRSVVRNLHLTCSNAPQRVSKKKTHISRLAASSQPTIYLRDQSKPKSCPCP